MRRLRFFIGMLLGCCICGCVDVKSLDDTATLTACSLVSVSPQTVVFNDPVLKADTIVLPLDYGKYEFPVTVSLDLRTAQTIDAVLGFDSSDQTLVFESPETVRRLHLVALSGVVTTYEVHIEVLPRSDEGLVNACSLTAQRPADFLLAPLSRVDQTQGEVLIYGIDVAPAWPLTVDVTLQVSEGASVQSQNGSSFTFSAFDQAVPFTVVASSGLEHAWQVRLVPVSVVDQVSQSTADGWKRMAPTGLQASLETPGPEVIACQVDDAANRVVYWLRSNDTSFPWNVRHAFEISPYAQAVGLAVEDVVSVGGWETQTPFYIIDMIDLQARAWSLLWEKWLSPQHEVLDFTPLSYHSAQGLMTLGIAKVDTMQSRILLPLEKGTDFPLVINQFSLQVSDYATALVPDSLLFLSHHTTYTFPVTAEDGSQRSWTLLLDPWYRTQSDITSFTVQTYHSMQGRVVFEDLQAQVDAENKEVVLVLKAGYDFPLTLEQVDLVLSPGASLQESYVQGFVFENEQTVLPLTVMAESQADSTLWHVRLSDERTENLEAHVLSYVVTQYSGTSSTEHNVVMEHQAVVDTVAHTISLRITDWSNKLPLTVNAVMAISKNATLTQPAGFSTMHTLVFDALDQTYTFTILSESQTRSTNWTIRLEDLSAVRSSQAQVLQFTTGNPSIGFEFDHKYLEPDKRLITLLVRTRPSATDLLTIAPRVTVSEHARLVGLVSGADVTLSFAEPLTFVVEAQDETQCTWTVQLLYAPQLPNSGFEQWGTVNGITNLLPSNGKGWTTGNNSQISGSTRVSGVSGYAARSVTKLNTVNLVIYKVTSVMAGAILTGSFTLKIGVDDVFNPTSMTDFGVPFSVDANPIGFEIDYAYNSQGNRSFTEPKYGAIIPSFKDPVKLPDTDRGSIIAEIHRTDGNWNYAANKDATLLASSAFYATNTNGWTHLESFFTPVAGRENEKMSHIVVKMSSSYEGDLFKGTDGSELLVDNFKLIYYRPQEGYITLP